MYKDIINTEIKIIKLNDYISRHPEKSIGYYCLARFYMDLGRYDMAEGFLKEILSKNCKFAPGIIAVIENYVKQGRFLKAVSYYEKHRHMLESKNILRLRTARAVTSVFDTEREMLNRKTSILPLQLLHPVSGLFSKKGDNLVTVLLLAMHNANNKAANEKALMLYRKILNMKGLSDNLRWHLLKLLGSYDPSLFISTDTASLFTRVPEGCSAEYANVIFSSALESLNRIKIKRVFDSIVRLNLPVSPSNLWKYVAWCRNESILDESVRECCRQLVKAGWMDKILLGTLTELRDKRGISLSPEENRALELFNYQ